MQQLITLNAMMPFPNTQRVKMRSVFRTTFTSSATIGTTSTQQVLQLNSLFEPMDTNAQQPYGFDQMSPLYNRYKVTACTVTVQLLPTIATPTSSLILMVQSPGGGASLSATTIQAAERPNATLLVTSRGAPAVWKRRFEIHQVAGVSKKEYEANLDDYVADVSGNPVKMPTLNIASIAFTATETTGAFITMEFEATFYERIVQAAS